MPPPEPDSTLRSATESPLRRSRRGTPRETRAPHIPAIDGLRAVAVLAVVAFHLNALPGGFLGVDLFFVVSGFVITSMLIFERSATGRVNVRQFWWRRVKRLLPAVLAVLVVVQLWLHALAPVGLDTVVNGQSLTALLNFTNWYNIFADFSYWDAAGDASPLNHLWSLAIEEQFYLLFPLFLVFLRSRRSIGIAAAVGIAASVSLMCTVGSEWTFDRLYQGTDIRVVALLAGVLLATVTVRPHSSASERRFVVRGRTGRVLVALLAGATVALMATMWIATPLNEQIFQGPLLVATALEVLLLALVVIDPRGLLTRLLQLKALVFIGKRSYALYLWHWPVIVIVSETHTGLAGSDLAMARILAITGLTLLSYAVIENPIRRSDGPPFRTVTGLAIPAALIIALAFTPAAATAALLPKGPASNTIPETDGAEWASLPISPGATVMVVGDSWAVNLAEGMMDPQFGTTVKNLGVGGCGILNPDAYKNDKNETYPPPAQCLTWEQDWMAAINEKRPDAVIIVAGNWDQKFAQLDGEWSTPGDKKFTERYSTQLDKALRLFTSESIPVYLSTTVTLNDARERSEAMNKLIHAAVERNAEASIIDLGGFLCRPDERDACPSTRDGQPIYDATGHPAPYWQQMMARYALGIVTSRLAEDTEG